MGDYSKFKKKGHCNSPLCNKKYGLSWSVMSAGEVFRLERYGKSKETADQRSQELVREIKFTAIPDRCIAVNCGGSV